MDTSQWIFTSSNDKLEITIRNLTTSKEFSYHTILLDAGVPTEKIESELVVKNLWLFVRDICGALRLLDSLVIDNKLYVYTGPNKGEKYEN